MLITHPLLDAFTSYGTQLFWPLTPPPVAWSTLFIIDPLYTLPLLVAVGAGLAHGLKDRTTHLPALALGLSCLYLAFSVAGKVMTERRVEQVLAAERIQPQALFIAPTPFNVLLWRVIVIEGDDYHEALVGWLDRAPPRLERIPRGGALAGVLRDSPQHQRLMWFTHGILRYDRIDDRLIVTDLRLGMTGFHPFRFEMARWEDGRWKLVEWVERLPARRGDLAHLRQLLARIWDARKPVPLAQWAQALTKP
ncbi:LexA-binding, inner membrane-associated putative hydrolase [compost metagenome]